MKVLPDARLQVVTPCKDHHSYTAHNDCQGPEFTILLEYDNPLATVEYDCRHCGSEAQIVNITAEQVIRQAFLALPDPEEEK